MELERFKKFIADTRNNQDIQSYEEATIEHAIVTPLLICLDWSISNNDGIKLRHRVGNDKVDYALFIKGKARVFIEVKRIGLQFDEKELKQILNYADYEGIELAVLTNGAYWWFYLPRETGPWEDRKFCNLDLLHDDIEFLVTTFNNLLGKYAIEDGEYLINAKKIQEISRQRKIILESLPKAWIKLVGESDQRLLDLLADTTEKLCRYKPDAEYLKKFLASVGDNSIRWEQQPVGPSQPRQTEKAEGILVCEGKRKRVHALGRYGPDCFWVLKGLTAILSETKTMPLSAKKNRDNLKKEGILRVVGNFYEFTSDSRFNSSSAAAGVVLARSANGKIEWKKTEK